MTLHIQEQSEKLYTFLLFLNMKQRSVRRYNTGNFFIIASFKIHVLFFTINLATSY